MKKVLHILMLSMTMLATQPMYGWGFSSVTSFFSGAVSKVTGLFSSSQKTTDIQISEPYNGRSLSKEESEKFGKKPGFFRRMVSKAWHYFGVATKKDVEKAKNETLHDIKRDIDEKSKIKDKWHESNTQNINDHQQAIKENNGNIESLKDKMQQVHAERIKELRYLQNKLTSCKDDLFNQIEDTSSTIAQNMDNVFKALKTKLKELKSLEDERKEGITEQEQHVQDFNSELNELKQIIPELSTLINNSQGDVKKLWQDIKPLTKKFNLLKNQVEQLEGKLATTTLIAATLKSNFEKHQEKASAMREKSEKTIDSNHKAIKNYKEAYENSLRKSAVLERRLERERLAREQAESLLDAKQKLILLSQSLQQKQMKSMRMQNKNRSHKALLSDR